MTYTTQCPACQTRFKVTDAQLSVADGLVRCGRCAHVFDAREHLQSSEPPRLDVTADAPPVAAPVAPPAPAPMPAMPASALDEDDDFELEVPDFDPTEVSATEAESGFDPAPGEAPHDEGQPSAQDVEAFQRALNEALAPRPHETGRPSYVEPLSADAAPAAEAVYQEPLGDPFSDEPLPDDAVPAIFDTRRTATRPAAAVVEAIADEPATTQPDFDPAMPADSLSDASTRRRGPLAIIIMGLLSLLGLVILVLQLGYINRTRISAEVPEMRPVLEKLCRSVGCTVPLPTDQEYIRTEWSELSFVPEHQNLILLSATLKNHAPYAQAFPMLEVTLKDADDQVLIRKTFTPREYLKADDIKLARFNANSEIKIGMRFDLGQVHAQGYSLYWFYP
jgi:predicted Zn finger-like uncharacterized protein